MNCDNRYIINIIHSKVAMHWQNTASGFYSDFRQVHSINTAKRQDLQVGTLLLLPIHLQHSYIGMCKLQRYQVYLPYLVKRRIAVKPIRMHINCAKPGTFSLDFSLWMISNIDTYISVPAASALKTPMIERPSNKTQVKEVRVFSLFLIHLKGSRLLLE